MTPLTRYLARLFGLTLLLIGLDIALDRPGMSATAAAFARDRAAVLTVGLLTLCAGLATVLGHNRWTGGVATVLVTLGGWLLVVKGATLLFLPMAGLADIVRFTGGPAWLWMAAALSLLWGGYLTFAGFRAPATVPPKQ